MTFFKTGILFLLIFCSIMLLTAQSEEFTITAIATNLNNPRGVALLSNGRLIIVEAGTGETEPAAGTGTGQITVLTDINGDGDYDDADEREVLLGNIPSYNSLPRFGSYHDEVFGAGDIVQLPDGRIFFTKDDPFDAPAPNRGGELFTGDTGIFEIVVRNDEFKASRLIQRPATMNGIVYDADAEVFYAVESGFNQLIAVDLDGNERIVATFEALASGQQPVPAGLTIDPRNGDVLVSLFSGFLYDYYGETLSFMPGDAKVVRVNPETGTVSDEITGLTTAIDVTADTAGNIFVAELTVNWATPLMSRSFDLYDPDQPPDPGGYVRNSGRVTMYPADGTEPIVLMHDVDTPTGLTFADEVLYVSTGLGTPGRNVISSQGIMPITGVVYAITGF